LDDPDRLQHLLSTGGHDYAVHCDPRGDAGQGETASLGHHVARVGQGQVQGNVEGDLAKDWAVTGERRMGGGGGGRGGEGKGREGGRVAMR
jgi:hypothetical protein